MREVTPAQQSQRDELVAQILEDTRTEIRRRGGDRLGHSAGRWRAFDNSGMLDRVYRDTQEIALRERRRHASDGQLPRPHVDNILMGACGLAQRGFHANAATLELTLRSARAAVSELAHRRREGFGEAFDPADQRMVYETIAAQAPLAGPGEARPAVGVDSLRVFPGGPRHVLAQQILADGATQWLAEPDCLWSGLMYFVQTEVEAGRLAPMRTWRELEQANELDASRVRAYLHAFADRIGAQRYYLPESQRLLGPRLSTNRSFVNTIATGFDVELAGGRSPAQAFFQLAVTAKNF